MDEGEVTRYEKFCQFKAEIRSSSDYLIVGIDVACPNRQFMTPRN